MDKHLVFFLDVDNTLLNNDLIKQEIKTALIKILGPVEAEHFWRHHDEFRAYQKLVDFPAITRSYCHEREANTCEMAVGNIFDAINFKAALFTCATEVIAHLKTFGTVCIFSEGDAIYQRKKIERSGLAKLVDHVFLYEHKYDHLNELKKMFPKERLIFIDDRDDTLAKLRQKLADILTIVVCQGHYAGPHCSTNYQAHRMILSIADILTLSKEEFLSHS